MGIQSSFITNYCTQINFDLTQKNLLSLGYQLRQNPSLVNDSQNPPVQQIYQHYQNKKTYILKTIESSSSQALAFSNALQALESIKNYHICNVLFSCFKSQGFGIIKTSTQISFFQEYSDFKFPEWVTQKFSNKEIQTMEGFLPYTNLEISHFIKNIAGILTEMQSLSLPVFSISPEQFLIFSKESEPMKYQINFEQFLTSKNASTENSYFAPQIFDEDTLFNEKTHEEKSGLWRQKHEKNLVFAFGLLTMHYLLGEPLYDCFNSKSNEFCQSELETKLHKLCGLLQTRHEQKQRQKSMTRQNNSSTEMTSVCIERFKTESKVDDQEPFELILYEMMQGMLAYGKQERMSIQEIKVQTKRLLQKTTQEFAMIKSCSSQQNLTSQNIQKAHETAPRIKSVNNETITESFSGFKMIKILSEHPVNSQNSFSESRITRLKPRQVSQKQKLIETSRQQSSLIHFTKRKPQNQKQNLQTNNKNHKDLQRSDIKSLKSSIRKLCGYKKMQISDNSYIEGFFQNDKAHGLGKITRRNGEVIECIFHNNEIIESISASPNKH